MKVIIAGSRKLPVNWGNLLTLNYIIENNFIEVSEVVSGAAMGADELGELWAKLHQMPLTQFYPDWDTHGKAAGPIRNKQMAEYADALILLWDGQSKGSASMLRYAKENNLAIYEDNEIGITLDI